MAAGGTYALRDATAAYSFPAPVSSWEEQPLGEGLNGIPVVNAYRLHAWRWVGLPADYMAVLTDFERRQREGNTRPAAVETDPYDPDCTYDLYSTETYDDVTIKSVTPRERGLPVYNNVTIVFEILIT